MVYFVAKNSRQLGICLKMIYDEKLKYSVTVYENEKRKIEYEVMAVADKELAEKLKERYRILIS